MSRCLEPMSPLSLLTAGAVLWRRNEGKLWANIDATERVLMAYANPRAAWAAGDDVLNGDSPAFPVFRGPA